LHVTIAFKFAFFLSRSKNYRVRQARHKHIVVTFMILPIGVSREPKSWKLKWSQLWTSLNLRWLAWIQDCW